MTSFIWFRSKCDILMASIESELFILAIFRSITLKPGDVILTGTPSGVGMYRNPPEYLREGDIIESTIEKVGKIRNRAIADTE